MAAIAFNAFVGVAVCVCLWGWGFESPPGVEAACETVGLISLPHQSQLPGVFSVFRAHVLDVNLKEDRERGSVSRMWIWNWSSNIYKYTQTNLAGFETKLDLNLTGLSADPHVHLRENGEENPKEWKTIIMMSCKLTIPLHSNNF